MRLHRVLPALSLILLAACEPSAPANPPPAPCPSVAATASAPATAASAAPTATPTATAYAGHGEGSVPPEVLARYAAPRLSSDVTRHIQSMLDVRAPAGGLLSPDGKRLFFTWTITGVRQIWQLDGPQRFPRQLTGGEDPTVIADITPDGKALIVSRDRKGEENPGLYLLDPEGGPLAVISHKTRVQTEYLFTTDDSKAVYFRANDKKPDSYAIYRYDLAAKKADVVFEQDGIWSVEDHIGESKFLMLKEIGSNMAEYYEYDVPAKKLTPLIGQGEREDYRAEYGAAPGEILVLTPKLGEYRRLYNLKGGKLSPITPEIKYDIDDFAIDKQRTRILYTTNEGGYTRLHAIDAKTFKELKLPALTGNDHVFFGSTTRDAKFSVLQVDPGTSPPQSYVLDWKSNKLTKWHAPSAPEIDTSKFARATLEEYTARDGTKIPMFVRRPAACDKPCPVLVSFHGGPEAQAQPGFRTSAQLFVDAGFIFVEPNVRGSEGYGKTWLHADDGPRRLNVITDIEDVAKHIRAKWAEGGKAPKIGVLGGSYGGYSTLIAMTMFAGAYDAGASNVGISNLMTFLMNTAPYRRILRISEYGDPEKDREALIKLSPTTYVDKVSSPLLIIQGATDPRVPAGEAIQIKQALDAKKIPAELIIFPDEGHGAQKRDNQVLQYGHMIRFFQEHLQGKKTAN